MKLRRILALVLALLLIIADSPLSLVDFVWAVDDAQTLAATGSTQTISAVDTDKIRLSNTIKKNAAALGRTDQATLKADQPTIETLLSDAMQQFNASGSEWNWFAYKVSVPTAGAYTLGVQTSGCKYASYKMPLYVNDEVYTLSFTAKSQLATTTVDLPAGEHVVTMFMPLPVNKAAISGNEWNDYHWCDVAFVAVDAALTVMAAPAVAEVEACFTEKTNIAVPAIDTSLVLRSAAVKYTEGANFVERGPTTGIYGDDPRIDSLLTDAIGQFNASGEEWPWIACKVSVPRGGTYTLGVKTNSCKWANFKLPMYVDGEVYTLTYTQKAQEVTAEVILPVGEHIVIVFWPMPANDAEAYTDDWNSYLWCNIESVTVDYSMSVLAAPTAAEVEADFGPKSDTVIFAADTDNMLWSAAMKHLEGNAYIERADGAGVQADKPYIDSLHIDASEEFNNSGSAWPWFAYKLSVPAESTYTLGVKTQGSKSASYTIPLCVNGQVYALKYTEKSQLVTTDVTLPAGEYVVTMFLPMPQNAESAENNVWNDYPWCNVESVVVDYKLTASKPTVAEVEDYFTLDDTVIAAIDDGYLLYSPAVGDNGYGRLEFNQRDAVKADLPYIESLYADAAGQFNITGEEWGWFAYKITARKAGTYSLGVDV